MKILALLFANRLLSSHTSEKWVTKVFFEINFPFISSLCAHFEYSLVIFVINTLNPLFNAFL